MIWFFAQLSLAQGLPFCDDPSPLAGTAGFENARNAVRTTVSTYGAGAFARRRLREHTAAVIDMHVIYNVARVPHHCNSQDGPFAGRSYEQPFDLAATNIGLRAPVFSDGPAHSNLRLFYASSVVTGTTMAGPMLPVLPMFNLYPALAAPVVGRSNAYVGISAYTVDWIAGASFRSDVLSVQAGYTGNRGIYLDITQDRYGLFTNGVVSEVIENGLTAESIAYLMGGVSDLDHADAFGLDKSVGMSSLYLRTLAQDRQAEAGAVAASMKPPSLKTVHLAQKDVNQRFDFNLTGQLFNGVRPRDLGFSYHSEGWHLRKSNEEVGQQFLVRAGVLSLPDQPLFGVKGGFLPSLRAEYTTRLTDREIRITGYLNEPEVLDLYPYAYNALAINVEMTFFLESI